MGYIRHHAIVVTSWDADLLAKVHARAKALGAGVSAVVPVAVNSGGSFLVAPDGSKEGWGDSDVGDAQRDAIIEACEEHRYEDGSTSVDWVEVQFGDDDGETKIVRHSDEPHRTVEREEADA